MVEIAIVIYSMYHHVSTLAESVKKGIESTGHKVTIYQVPETLDDEILNKMHAPPKPNYPIATPDVLYKADGILFGFPTRFGALPAQMKAFIDSTGGLWQEGKLYQKPAGAFLSTGGCAGGRETTIHSLLSTLSHHGMIYVPLGFAPAFAELTNLDHAISSSAWGACTLSYIDGSRTPTEDDLKVAFIQGAEFVSAVLKITGKNKSQGESKPAAAAAAAPAAAPSAAKPAAKPAAKKPTKPTESTTKSKPVETKQEAKKKNPVSRFFSKLFN